MKYFHHTNIKPDEPIVWPDHVWSDGGVVSSSIKYAPEINPDRERVFPDSVQTESWKIDGDPQNKSFKNIKRDREIKMTDYSVGTVTTSRYLVKIPRLASKGVHYRSYKKPVNKPVETVQYGPVLMNTHYIDNYDAIRAADSFPAVEYSRHFDSDEINSILNSLKSDVVQNSFSGFDLLTELAEFPETLEMIIGFLKAARHPLKGMRELQEKYQRSRRRGNSHEVAHQEIAGQWMQYRYGIMPLVYSIVDAVKLLEEGMTEFKTDRAFSVLRSKPVPVHSTESHVAIYRGHETKISVVGKASYSSPRQRFTDLITTNLFLTAWELIPLSFVVDWFINVGDVIFSRTSTLVDLSKERKFCYSIRRTLIDKHYLVWNFQDGTTHTMEPWATSSTDRWLEPITVSNETINMGQGLLYERREESYERRVFSPTDITPEFGPDLNWMRMLDGYILSFNKIRKVLKSFS